MRGGGQGEPFAPNMSNYVTSTNYNNYNHPALFAATDNLSSNFNSTNGGGAGTAYKLDDNSHNQLLMAAFAAAASSGHDTQPSPTVNITVPTNRWVKN